MNDTFSLTQLIDQWVATREDKEYKSWRASRIGQCPRAHYLLRKGAEQTNPPDERTLRVFAAGDTFHKFVQDIAEEQGSENKVEQEVFDEKLDLGGRYDLLVKDKEKTILYDIKSVHSRAFWNMEKEDREVYPHHKMQLGAYMVMLKDSGEPVDEGRMFYISKDDLVTKEVTIALTEELEKSVRDELALLNKHWKENTLPKCTCAGTKWGVMYCPFADPDSEESVEVVSASGRTYKKRQLTKCCNPAPKQEKLDVKTE